MTDVNGRKHGGDDKHCTIRGAPAGGRPISLTGKAARGDAAARIAANIPGRAAGTGVFGKAERHGHDPSPDKTIWPFRGPHPPRYRIPPAAPSICLPTPKNPALEKGHVARSSSPSKVITAVLPCERANPG